MIDAAVVIATGVLCFKQLFLNRGLRFDWKPNVAKTWNSGVPIFFDDYWQKAPFHLAPSLFLWVAIAIVT